MKKTVKILCFLLTLTLTVFSVSACKDNKPTKSDSSNSSSTATSNGTPSSTESDSASSTDGSTSFEASSTASTDADGPTSNGSSSTVSGTASDSTSSTEAPDSKPTVYLKSALNGETVTVTLAVKNNSGLSGFDIKLAYDPKIVKASGFDDVMRLGIASNLMQSAENCNGTVTAVYAAAAGFKADGDVFSVTFKLVDKTADSTEFKIEAENNSFVDLTVQYADFKTENSTLKLK